MDVKLSIVSPVYKAQELVEELVFRIAETVEKITTSYEIILVDDYSPDLSWKVIEKICLNNQKVIGIQLSRNFGQHYAITAGLDKARGEWIVVMDCDLQMCLKKFITFTKKQKKDMKLFWLEELIEKIKYHKNFSRLFFINF